MGPYSACIRDMESRQENQVVARIFKIRLETDSSGPKECNQKLSERRACAVKQAQMPPCNFFPFRVSCHCFKTGQL